LTGVKTIDRELAMWSALIKRLDIKAEN